MRVWRTVLTARDDTVQQITQAGQGGTQTTIPVTSTSAYTYQVTYPLLAQECADCVAGMYWGNQNDGDYLDFYNGHFMGFAQTTVAKPDGSLEYHHFYATEGFGVYDTREITSCPSNLPPVNTVCHNTPWWDLPNAAHGRETEVDYTDTDGTTLLKKVTSTYGEMGLNASKKCLPSGVSGSPTVNGMTWDGNLVSELDNNNPVALCDVELTQQVTTTYDGGTNSISDTESSAYGSYGNPTQTTSVSSSGTPGTIVHNTSFTWHDAVSATASGATGTYLVESPAFTDIEDGQGNRVGCAYSSYDGAAYTTGSNASLKYGNVSEADKYTNCGTAANGYTPSGLIGASAEYDKYGNQQGSNDADANANVSCHTGCIVGDVQYTTCTNYDADHQANQTSNQSGYHVGTQTKNLGTATGYSGDGDATGGFGTWAIASTDVEKVVTPFTYDPLERVTQTASPPDANIQPTTRMA